MGAAMTTMLSSSRLGLLFLLSAATLVSAAPLSASCRTIHPAADFSVEAYLGKLEVAPCFLPAALSGPYWVMHFDAIEGWALIVGGQPTIPTTGGLCKTGNGINNAGLWIFGRKQARNETQITIARNIATAKGLDVSVLNDIDQTNCTVE